MPDIYKIFIMLSTVFLGLGVYNPANAQKMQLKQPSLEVIDPPGPAPGLAPPGRDSLLTPYSLNDSTLSLKPAPLKRYSFHGYYRLLGYGRNMTQPYPDLPPYERVAGIGDVYREPMLSFWFDARPNGRSNFGTELFFFNPYLGGGPADNVFTMNLGVNFYGNFRTDLGKFGIRAGGIHWYNVSSLTMGTFQILDRYSIFERTPWEGVNNTEKYDNYYQSGLVNRDGRWGLVAFQGLVFEGSSLPGDFAFKAFYGKTQANGGLFTLKNDGQGNFSFGAAESDPLNTIINPGNAGNVPTYNGFSGVGRVIPSLVAGGRLEKKFGINSIAYNTLHSWSHLDSIQALKRGFQVHSLSYDWTFKGGFRISGELGMGNFFTPDEEFPWGEALTFKFTVPKNLTYLDLDVQLYQISKNFYNINSEVQTFSNPDFPTLTLGAQQNGQATGANNHTVTGQLAHNRRGFNIITGRKFGWFDFKAGLGIAHELEATTNQLSYDHRINGLAISRIYNPFPANATGPTIAGPYNRLATYFRGAYEIVNTTDIDPATAKPLNRKYFNSIDLQAKVKAKALKRDLYLFYLGTFLSSRQKFGLIPQMADDTYILAQYHELDLYYELFPNFIFAGYLGLEFVNGGFYTEWDIESQLPRNQIGQGYGIGFDYKIAPTAGIYVRHRWMDFQDKSFSLDKYKGTETTIELKIFF